MKLLSQNFYVDSNGVVQCDFLINDEPIPSDDKRIVRKNAEEAQKPNVHFSNISEEEYLQEKKEINYIVARWRFQKLFALAFNRLNSRTNCESLSENEIKDLLTKVAEEQKNYNAKLSTSELIVMYDRIFELNGMSSIVPRFELPYPDL